MHGSSQCKAILNANNKNDRHLSLKISEKYIFTDANQQVSWKDERL